MMKKIALIPQSLQKMLVTQVTKKFNLVEHFMHVLYA